MEIEPAWNTWDSVYPAQMTYLPLGLTVTPCAYAASTGTFSTFPATAKGLALGTREIDASAVNLHLALSGTELEWHYQRTSARQLRGGWEWLSVVMILLGWILATTVAAGATRMLRRS